MISRSSCCAGVERCAPFRGARWVATRIGSASSLFSVTTAPLQPMIIGVPQETQAEEHRVALLPSAAYQLSPRAHRAIVERGAGVGSGYLDEEYIAAGAEIIGSPQELFEA